MLSRVLFRFRACSSEQVANNLLLIQKNFFLSFLSETSSQSLLSLLLHRIDLFMIQMTKNEMFSHSGVFANLADENSVIIFALSTL